MARKKKDQVPGALTALLFAAGGYTYLNTSSPATAAVVFVGGLTLILLALFAISLLKARKLSASGILQVDQMTGSQFEDFLRLRYQARGYRVRQTPYRNDFGADLILERGGQRIVVQAKRYKHNVGIRAVQEVFAARQHYKADAAWVVTNSQFTKAATELAKSNGVRLVDRVQLIHILMEEKAG